MKNTANLATYPPRLDSLGRVIRSIYDQFDEIRICCNEMPHTVPNIEDKDDKIQLIFPKNNLTDNGKFWALDYFDTDQHEYFFTLDDDLIYPPDYVERTVTNIEKFGLIVSYHGRKLLRKDVDYYSGHKGFHCLNQVKGNVKVDVCGTGVTAFDTRYFHPKGLASHKLQLMSDLIFSLEAAKQGKRIGVMEHEAGWIKCIMHKETIFKTESRTDQKDQIRLSNQIIDLNH